MNNDMLPIGTTVHINPKDIKWEVSGDLISRSALKKKFDEYIKANPNIAGAFELGKLIIDNAPAKEERPQGDIRWTDKVSVTSSGDIIDFEGRVVGHINLEDMKGGNN